MDVGKHVPIIPVILLTDALTLPHEIHRFGTCTRVCPNHPSEIILEVERSIDRVESTLIHILAVDDDLKVLAILRALLVPWGFRITTLSDPQKFWEFVPVIKPDLLILDLEMPTVTGIELCQSVRDQADWLHLPIIFLTARTEPHLIQQVFTIGADDFVNKPVIGPEIISRITNLMERQQVKKLRANERTRVDSGLHQSEIHAALTAIQQSLKLENERHDQVSKEILDRLDLLQQLLKSIY